MKKTSFRIHLLMIIGLCLVLFIYGFASATIIDTVKGVSVTGDNVIFESQFSIQKDTLTLTIFNISPDSSNSPDDLLSSFFFDIKNAAGIRPNLILQSAVGDVYKTNKNNADSLQSSNLDLIATSKKTGTWQYRTLDSSANPSLGFGVGTVGNSNLGSNNFKGNLVGGFDYSIYSGDVTTQSLHNTMLVKNSATFTFTGLTGFTENDISKNVAFGMGTAPDTILVYNSPTSVPEPSIVAMLTLGCLFLRKK